MLHYRNTLVGHLFVSKGNILQGHSHNALSPLLPKEPCVTCSSDFAQDQEHKLSLLQHWSCKHRTCCTQLLRLSVLHHDNFWLSASPSSAMSSIIFWISARTTSKGLPSSGCQIADRAKYEFPSPQRWHQNSRIRWYMLLPLWSLLPLSIQPAFRGLGINSDDFSFADCKIPRQQICGQRAWFKSMPKRLNAWAIGFVSSNQCTLSGTPRFRVATTNVISYCLHISWHRTGRSPWASARPSWGGRSWSFSMLDARAAQSARSCLHVQLGQLVPFWYNNVGFMVDSVSFLCMSAPRIWFSEQSQGQALEQEAIRVIESLFTFLLFWLGGLHLCWWVTSWLCFCA